MTRRGYRYAWYTGRPANDCVYLLVRRPLYPRPAGAADQGRSRTDRHRNRPATRARLRAVLHNDGPATRLARRSRAAYMDRQRGYRDFRSAATVACGLARSFGQLFLARVSVGVGEATLSPCALSMIADSFPEERRGKPIAFYSAALTLGAGIASLAGRQRTRMVENCFGHRSAYLGPRSRPGSSRSSPSACRESRLPY